jgi:surface protein
MSKETIKCQNNTIKRHVKEQIELLGNEADLNHLDVSEVTNMEVLFVKYEDFNGDVSSWNVSNVKDMRSMFNDTQFNGDLSSWDIVNV